MTDSIPDIIVTFQQPKAALCTVSLARRLQKRHAKTLK